MKHKSCPGLIPVLSEFDPSLIRVLYEEEPDLACSVMSQIENSLGEMAPAILQPLFNLCSSFFLKRS
jgi:hypothetical protein